MKGQGLLRWRGFDEYIVFEQGVLLMKSLVKEQPLITYNPLEIDQKPCFQVDELEISPNKTFFYLVSYKRNKIWVIFPLILGLYILEVVAFVRVWFWIRWGGAKEGHMGAQKWGWLLVHAEWFGT